MQHDINAAIAAQSSSSSSSSHAHSSHPPPSYPRSSEPRMPAPPTYTGNASTLDEWFGALSRQFKWYEFPTPANDEDRIRLATAHLGGTAWEWYDHLSEASIPTSWVDFVALLRKRFQPVTSAQTARAKLIALSQGKTSSVNDYVAAFRKLIVAIPQMQEDEKLFYFLRGLRSETATLLQTHKIVALEDAIETATRIGGIRDFNVSQSAHGGTPSSSSSSSSQATPMDLDAMLEGIEGLERDTAAAAGTSSSSSSSASSSDKFSISRNDFQQLLAAMQQQRKGFGRFNGAGGDKPKGYRSP